MLAALLSPGLLACWCALQPGPGAAAEAPPPQRRRLLQGAVAVGSWWVFGLPSRAEGDEEAGEADELYGELFGTSTGDECSCCERDWCCKGDCVDCHAYLKAKGYAVPLTAGRAYGKGGRAGWPAELDLRQPELQRLPRWRPVSGPDLQVKNSSIEGAGEGLFAAAGLRLGAVLPPYRGDMLSFAEGKAKMGSPYLWCPVFSYAAIMGDEKSSAGDEGKELSACVDAAGQPSAKANPARFINGAASRAQCEQVNVEMCELGQVLYFRTTKAVAAGSELLVDYGPDYWKGFACSEQG